MGWSCRAEAGAVLDAWRDACVADSGTSNGYKVRGVEYFWEVGREQWDGAITGTVHRTVRVEGDAKFCRPSGTFRVEPDGRVTRGPAMLKRAARDPRTLATIQRIAGYAVGSSGR